MNEHLTVYQPQIGKWWGWLGEMKVGRKKILSVSCKVRIVILRSTYGLRAADLICPLLSLEMLQMERWRGTSF